MQYFSFSLQLLCVCGGEGVGVGGVKMRYLGSFSSLSVCLYTTALYKLTK